MKDETATTLYANNSSIHFNESYVLFYTEYRGLTGISSVKYKVSKGVPQTLFSESEAVVSDFQVIKNDTGGTIAIWKQVEMEFPDNHRIFFGVIDSTLNLISKNEIKTEATSIKFHTLRGVISGDFIIVSAYDIDNEKIMVVNHNYTIDNGPEKIHYLPGAPSAEFRDLRHSLVTNIQLLQGGEAIYLQANMENQVLRTWQMSILNDSSLAVDVLFDFADSNLGFHRTIIDESGEFMLIVFSGSNKNTATDNDIYIVKQPLFARDNINRPRTTTINQTHGYYTRPEIVSRGRDYWLFWEGNHIYYTAVNSELQITVPESKIDANIPSNILSLNSDELIISYTSNKLPTLNSGLSFEVNTIQP